MVASDVRTDATVKARASGAAEVNLRRVFFVSVGMASDYWAEVVGFPSQI